MKAGLSKRKNKIQKKKGKEKNICVAPVLAVKSWFFPKGNK